MIRFVEGVESSVVHYGDISITFLENLRRADDAGRGLTYVSAVAIEEKSVWDYNQGNPSGDPETLGKLPPPKVPLVAIYPKEGTIVNDHPYVALDAPWVDAQKRDAAPRASFGSSSHPRSRPGSRPRPSATSRGSRDPRSPGRTASFRTSRRRS